MDFFPTTCRIPLATDATRLTAVLQDLTHELTLWPNTAPANPHGTPLNVAVRKLQQVLKPTLTHATDKIVTILGPKSKEVKKMDNTEPPRVVGEPAPRVVETTVPRVSEVRGQYAVGTSITKKFNNSTGSHTMEEWLVTMGGGTR